MGLDSLMAVELKNRVELDLGIPLPVIDLLQGPSVAQLATLLLERLTTKPASAAASAPYALPPEQLLARLDSLSDAEIDKLLAAELESDAETG
jgi:phthiocerol/phenolphthiocerol synthesis type-I polyketide synthase D